MDTFAELIAFTESIQEATFNIGAAASRVPSAIPTKNVARAASTYPVQTRAPVAYSPQSLQLPRLQITRPLAPATKAAETGAGRFAAIKAQGQATQQPQQPAVTQAAPRTVPPAVTRINAPTVATGKNGQLSPAELVKVGKYNAGSAGMRQWYANDAYLAPAAAQAFNALQQSFGRPINISSAYRNLEHQKGLSGEGHAVVARSGTSKHGLGRALDVSPNQDPEGYKWLKQNGPQFGWQYANIPGDPYHFEYKGAV